MKHPITKLEVLVHPYAYGHDMYQKYYRTSLKTHAISQGLLFQECGPRAIIPLRWLRWIRDSYRLRTLFPGLGHQRLINTVAKWLSPNADDAPSIVGEYTFYSGSNACRFAIDPLDSGELGRSDLTNQVTVYFKTNYWPTRRYPPNVLPLPNLNPLVLGQISKLRRLRSARKEYDLFAFFRIWGGCNEVEGVEHNLRLCEALAKVKCRKFLLAFLVTGDIEQAKRRLDKAGVEWTVSPMKRTRLWELTASSRLSLVRHGMHECIPWRMTETLAMGSCPVLDYTPRTRWPIPLEENVHYLNLDCPFDQTGVTLPSPAATANKVTSWLAQDELIKNISANTARYFDDNLEPSCLGKYLVTSVINHTLP